MAQPGGAERLRLSRTLIIFVIWATLTMGGGKLVMGHRVDFTYMVTHGVSLHILLACMLLIAAIAWFGWRDVGLVAPSRMLRLLWPPLLYFIVPIAVIVAIGPPPAGVVGLVLLNGLLIGISEELMFRGLLFRAFTARLTIWPAILLTSALFGLAHVANVLVTGQFIAALTQACAAFLSGLLFIALVVRTGSIWPSIRYHAAWDAASFLVVIAARSQGAEAGESLGAPNMIVPLLLVLPNGLYGLFLLRNIGREDRVTTQKSSGT